MSTPSPLPTTTNGHPAVLSFMTLSAHIEPPLHVRAECVQPPGHVTASLTLLPHDDDTPEAA